MNDLSAHSVVQTGADAAPLYPAAYQSLWPEISAVSEADFATINVDVHSAIMTVLGSIPEILYFRDQAAALPDFDISCFDKLQVTALALIFANARHQAAIQQASPVESLAARAAELRELFICDVTALAKRKLIDGSCLSRLQGPVGYRNLLADLTMLVHVLQSHADRIQGKSGVEAAELQEAQRVAQELMIAIGLREEGPSNAAETALNRQRAFTLFVRRHDQVRRALTYLRWDAGDLERIAPSLYNSRAASRRKTEEPDTPQATATPAPERKDMAPAQSPSEPVPVGMPGASPFVDA